MTKSEIAKILAVLAASYSKFDVDDLKVQVWHEMLGDLDYKLVQVAVQKLILESPYPPAIADIRKQVVEITTPHDEKIDAATAWGEVEKAIQLYGYYREAEAMASMSPRTAKIVKYIGWQEICLSEEPGVVRGQFLKMYQQIADREQKEKLLPQGLRDEMQRLVSRMNVKVIAGGKANEN